MGMSLDGIVAIPRGDRSMPVMEGEWGLPPEDPKLTEVKLAWLRDAGAHLMGRATYEEMAGDWPTSTGPYAAPMVRHDLIDEYRLITHPVAVGSAAPLFNALETPLTMELVETKTFGNTLLRVYRRTAA